METADVVIVGGGIVGSAVAYFLSTSTPRSRAAASSSSSATRAIAEASTARSAGGLRQQFSTPENIALSQFTLSLFRRLEAVFGPDADVGFREQGYLIMASPEARSVLAENVALQQSMRADIELLRGARARAAVPLDRDRRRGGGRLRPLRRGLVRSAEPRRAVSQCGQGAEAPSSSTIASPASTCAATASRRCGWQAAAASPAARSSTRQGPGPASWRRWRAWRCRSSRASATSTSSTAARPPTRCIGAPLTVDPSGVWFRPEGRFFLCGKSPEAGEEPPATDLDAIDHAFFESEVWPRLAARVPAFESVKVVNAWAGYYDYQHARPERRDRRAPRDRQSLFRQRLLRPRRPAGGGRRPRRRRADRARRLPDHRPDAARLRAHRRTPAAASSAT